MADAGEKVEGNNSNESGKTNSKPSEMSAQNADKQKGSYLQSCDTIFGSIF